jgi:uncharacterized membrane protein
MAEQAQELSTENRLLAALAHGSIVAQGLGLIAGILIYINQREKSPYVAFQALQAAIYQLISLIIVIASWLAWTGFYMLSFIPIIQNVDKYSDAPPPIFWIGMGSMVIPFAIMTVIGLYGLWGAIRVFQGKDFRYILIGRWLEQHVQLGD